MPFTIPTLKTHPSEQRADAPGRDTSPRLAGGSGARDIKGARSWANQLRSLGYRTLIRRPFRSLTPSINAGAVHRAFDAKKLLTYEPAEIERARADFRAGNGPAHGLATALCALADEALTRGPFSVVDKTSLPLSQDPHDYWHPAPYYWPNPKKPGGIPYIKRDGERAPGTLLYEPASERYDRSRLQRLFDDSTLLTLAWTITGHAHYARHAARHLVHWFIAPETRMNPHLKFAQIILTTRKGRWSSAGIIETKDFYYYLDAVRLLREGGFLDDATHAAFGTWLRSFRTWLMTSRQGKRECAKPNNHGLLYDCQLAAIAAFLDDPDHLATIFRRVRSRLLQHFEPDGSQPYELVRTISAHYCAFNLQSWLNIARLAERCGFSLWSVESPDGRGLKQALAWLLAHNTDRIWPHRQINPFDWNRLTPLAFASDHHYGTPFVATADAHPTPHAPVCFHPHDGIPPAWELTLPALRSRA